MGRLSFIFNFKESKTLQALINALSIIIGIELGCALVLPQSPMIAAFKMTRIAVETQPAPAIQIMGDSIAHSALFASIVKQTVGISEDVVNYSMRGSGPIFSYFLLRSQIKSGNVPRAIILAHAPHTYSGVRFPVLVGRFCYWSEIGELLISGHRPFDVLFGVATKISYTLSYRSEIKKTFRGDLLFFKEQEPVLTEQERIQGAAELPQEESVLPENVDIMYHDTFSVSAINRRYMEKFFHLANRNGVEVYWLTLPVTKKVYDIREVNGFHAEYYSFIDQMQKKFNFGILQKEFVVYPDDHFRDYSHLKVQAGILFSRYLANRIK